MHAGSEDRRPAGRSASDYRRQSRCSAGDTGVAPFGRRCSHLGAALTLRTTGYTARRFMRAVDIIRAKRDGEALGRQAIDAFVAGLLDGSWADYQTSAMLMAIVLRGMTAEETALLTDAMVRSGAPRRSVACSAGRRWGSTAPAASATRSRSCWPRWSPPAAWSCPRCRDAASATPAARSTSSSPFPASASGCRPTSSSPCSREVGCAIVGQTADIAPADKVLYALRDVTATIESVPAHLGLGDEQEARRGQPGAGSRREVRPRRLHEDARRGAGAGAIAGCHRHRPRRAHRSVRHRDGRAARPRRRQRPGDRRVPRGAGRRRPRRPALARRDAGGACGRARRLRPRTPTRRGRWCGARSTLARRGRGCGRWSPRRAAIRR